MNDPRPSATVVLIRQDEPHPQVFMVKRHARTAFGMAHAFPGGVVDSSDCKAHAHCAGVSAEQADIRLAVPGAGLDFYSAAIRELFEETGVLLARDRGGEWAFSGPSGGRILSGLRERLNSGDVNWLYILQQHDLSLECDALHYFAHWITPASEPKRFTTRFFAAEIPHSQEANHDGAELTEGTWISASDVLAAREAGEMNLAYPTCATLKAISDYATVGQIFAWTRRQAAGGVVAVEPFMLDIEGRRRVVLPGDDLYPRDLDG